MAGPRSAAAAPPRAPPAPCLACLRSYPKKLAFQYLEELAREFGRLYGSQVDTVQRPYAFIKFGERWGGAHRRAWCCVSTQRPALPGAGNGLVQGWRMGRHENAALRLRGRSCVAARVRRHLHPKDQEAVPRHEDAAQHGDAEQ